MNTSAPGSILVSDNGQEVFFLQSRAEEMTTLVLCQYDHVGGFGNFWCELVLILCEIIGVQKSLPSYGD